MSREIKFRAWDEVDKQWIYLDLIDLRTNQLERQGFSGMRVTKWCEYTGLKDKNGVEIYQGDWLADDEFKYEVYFDEVDCVFKLKDCDSDMETINRDWTEWFEVVGNIYESK